MWGLVSWGREVPRDHRFHAGEGPEGTLTVSVTGDLRKLWDWQGWQNPAATLSTTPTTIAQDYAVYTGKPEAVFKAAMSQAITRLGAPVAGSWAVVANHGYGSTTVRAELRMHPLGDKLIPLLDAENLIVTLAYPSGSLVRIDVREAKTVPGILTVASGVPDKYSFNREIPTATRVVVGGRGEGADRVFVQVIDSAREADWGDIVEVFKDARNSDEGSDITIDAREALAEGAPCGYLDGSRRDRAVHVRHDIHGGRPRACAGWARRFDRTDQRVDLRITLDRCRRDTAYRLDRRVLRYRRGSRSLDRSAGSWGQGFREKVAMTITSVGYAGDITDANWRRMATATIGALYGVDDFASWRVTVGTGDRALRVAAGGAFGLGVRDVSDAPITVAGATVATGSRWDLVVARRNWGTKVTSVVIIAGTAVKALPARNVGFGALNDQPLALVRFAAGQTAAQEIIDLRCIPGDAGLVAFDSLSRSYLDRVGTQVRIGDFLWARTVDAAGSPAWSYVDVTPDTGWMEITRDNGWVWNFGQARRIGSQISARLSAARTQGWSPTNRLAILSAPFRPDTDWYVNSSANSGKTEFKFAPDGLITASQLSGGAVGVTLHTTYPAARPTI